MSDNHGLPPSNIHETPSRGFRDSDEGCCVGISAFLLGITISHKKHMPISSLNGVLLEGRAISQILPFCFISAWNCLLWMDGELGVLKKGIRRVREQSFVVGTGKLGSRQTFCKYFVPCANVDGMPNLNGIMESNILCK